MLIGLIYLFSYMLDPVVLVFKFEPLETEFIRRISQIVTFFIVFDILLQPFTGTLKDDFEIPDENKDKR